MDDNVLVDVLVLLGTGKAVLVYNETTSVIIDVKEITQDHIKEVLKNAYNGN